MQNACRLSSQALIPVPDKPCQPCHMGHQTPASQQSRLRWRSLCDAAHLTRAVQCPAGSSMCVCKVSKSQNCPTRPPFVCRIANLMSTEKSRVLDMFAHGQCWKWLERSPYLDGHPNPRGLGSQFRVPNFHIRPHNFWPIN